MNHFGGYRADLLRQWVGRGKPSIELGFPTFGHTFSLEQLREFEHNLLLSLQKKLVENCQSEASIIEWNNLVAAAAFLLSLQGFPFTFYPEKVRGSIQYAFDHSQLLTKLLLTWITGFCVAT
jgi:hypothetical protein